MNHQNICVLLASYNGEKYIEQQIESVLNQDKLSVVLLVRDDGSTDNTLVILDCLKKLPVGTEIDVVKNSSKLKGHSHNFSALCNLATKRAERYFCFSDQDDVWYKDKLEKLYNRMLELEKEHGRETPILIHSDLTVVDEALNEIAPSFIEYQGIPDPVLHDFPTFCYQNVVTGCTVLFNRALLEVACPMPQEVVVHDWWFAQCAKLFGVLDYYNEPLVYYRQHGANAIGATASNQQKGFFNKQLYKALLRYPKHLSQSIEQAKQLFKVAQKSNYEVNSVKLKYVQEFSSLKESSLFTRLKYAHCMFHKKVWLERMFMYFAYVIVKYIN